MAADPLAAYSARVQAESQPGPVRGRLTPWERRRALLLAGICPGPPHEGHASSDWTCPLEDRQPPNIPYTEWAAMVCIAEEALNRLDQLARTPGNRIIVMQRAAELRASLNVLAAARA